MSTVITRTPVEERVARGVEWLDEVQPDWRDRVNVEALDMRSACQCICGQVFAEAAEARQASNPEYSGYQYARDLWWLEMGKPPFSWSQQHGFTAVLPDATALSWTGLDDNAQVTAIFAAWRELEQTWLRELGDGLLDR